MRRSWLIIVVAAVMIPALASAAEEGDAPEKKKSIQLKTEKQKLSYAYGMQIAKSLQQSPIDVNTKALTEGLKDVLGGKETQLSSEEATSVLQTYAKKMQEEQAAKQKEADAAAKKKSDKFLSENKTKEEVQTTNTGLQYKVVKEGDGESPGQSDQVKALVRIKQQDGSVLMDTFEKDQAVTIPVQALMPGFTEGVQLMEEGGRYKFFVPPKLGLGEKGRQMNVNPNAVLILDIELQDVMEGSAQQQPMAPPGAGAPSN